MQTAIHVERDAHGLQLAVRELFEESFFDDAMKPLLSKLGDDEETRERIMMDAPPRTLSPGYYLRAGYLLDLGASIEAGVGYDAGQLRRGDVVGLLALRRAKAEFERDHPACGACGARQDNRYMQSCKRCRAKFAGRD